MTIKDLGSLVLGAVWAQIFYWFGYAVGYGLLRKDKDD